MRPSALLFLLTAACTAPASSPRNADAPPSSPVASKIATKQAPPDEAAAEKKPASETTAPSEEAPPAEAGKAASPQAAQDDCQVEVYVVDPDPAGLNVRAEPSAKAKIVGNVAKDPDGTVLNVTSSRNGWLKVSQASPMNADEYELDGWVSGRMTQTSLRCTDPEPESEQCFVSLRAGPSLEEKEVGRVSLDSNVTVIGCEGEWVRAQTSAGEQGWLEPNAQCPNPVTSCP